MEFSPDAARARRLIIILRGPGRAIALDWGADYVSIPGRDHVSTLTSRAFKDAAIAFLA
jgi:hypothetical protein